MTTPAQGNQYLALFDSNPQPVFVWEPGTGRILAANRSGCEAYGFSREELLQMSVLDLRGNDAKAREAPLPQAGSVIVRKQYRRDGTMRESEMHTASVTWDGEAAMMTLLVDVTERNAYARHALRIGRMYATTSKINRAIFGLPDRRSILKAACDIAVEAGEFRLAWIGILNEQTHYVDVAAQAGPAAAYLRNIRVTDQDVPEGRGPMGTAMRERRMVVENDFLASTSTTPWHLEAARHELHAAIFSPIYESGRVIGALGLYGGEAQMFGEQEQRLITELSEDIGLALHDLNRRNRLRLEERIRSVSLDVYELIAEDAPFERINARLQQLRNMPDCDVELIRAAEQLERIAVERVRSRERLEHQSLHDSLTDLPNRVLFVDRLTQALAASQRRGTRIAVGLLDLDRFKTINDTLGHAHGDALLRAVAQRFQSAARAGETVARMGGDEFLILFTDLPHLGQAEQAMRRLLDTLAQPFQVAGRELYVNASAGLVLADPQEKLDSGLLLQRADSAMYRAKRAHAGYVIDMGEAHERKAISDLDVESDLHRAIERGEFILDYQPFIDVAENRVSAVEALIRWQHPVHGILQPDEFIPIAEETGLIVPIGEWTLVAACAQAMRWAAQGHDLAVAVNISARQFAQPGLQASVQQALSESGLPPERLMLEVTETSIMESPAAAAATLAELKNVGVRITIDDFGTGYSSLAYLHHFPIDILKIDRSFVSGIVQTPMHVSSGSEIARAIVALAHGLSVGVVAEGVETPYQREKLLELGCRVMQGFLLARPMPGAAIVERCIGQTAI